MSRNAAGRPAQRRGARDRDLAVLPPSCLRAVPSGGYLSPLWAPRERWGGGVRRGWDRSGRRAPVGEVGVPIKSGLGDGDGKLP